MKFSFIQLETMVTCSGLIHFAGREVERSTALGSLPPAQFILCNIDNKAASKLA